MLGPKRSLLKIVVSPVRVRASPFLEMPARRRVRRRWSGVYAVDAQPRRARIVPSRGFPSAGVCSPLVRSLRPSTRLSAAAPVRSRGVQPPSLAPQLDQVRRRPNSLAVPQVAGAHRAAASALRLRLRAFEPRSRGPGTSFRRGIVVPNAYASRPSAEARSSRSRRSH